MQNSRILRWSGSFFSIGLIFIIACSDNDIPGPSQYRLSKILNYSNSTSKTAGGWIEYSYEKGGNLIKESFIQSPDIIILYILYEYNNPNKKKTKSEDYSGEPGKLTLGSYTEYFYSGDKLIREELYRNDGTLFYSTHYEYNGKNLINTYKDEDGLGIHHQFKYFFDNKNRLELEQVYMYNQELSEFTRYYYDELDRLIKLETYDNKEKLQSSTKKEYQGKGIKPTKEFDYKKDVLIQERRLTYDNWGNLTSTIVNVNGSDCALFKRKYNGRLLTEEITYLPNYSCTEWNVSRYEYSKK